MLQIYYFMALKSQKGGFQEYIFKAHCGSNCLKYYLKDLGSRDSIDIFKRITISTIFNTLGIFFFFFSNTSIVAIVILLRIWFLKDHNVYVNFFQE